MGLSSFRLPPAWQQQLLSLENETQRVFRKDGGLQNAAAASPPRVVECSEEGFCQKRKKPQMMQLLDVGCKTRRLGIPAQQKRPAPQSFLQRLHRGVGGNRSELHETHIPDGDFGGQSCCFGFWGRSPVCRSTPPGLAGTCYPPAGSPAWCPAGRVGDAVCSFRFVGQTFGDSGKVYLALTWLHQCNPVSLSHPCFWGEGGEPGRAPSFEGPRGLLEGKCPGQASVSAALGRAWSGEVLPGIASRPNLFRIVLGQNVHFLVFLALCPSRWEGGSMGRRGGMCPVARAAPQPVRFPVLSV